jgi:hypothetical protein
VNCVCRQEKTTWDNFTVCRPCTVLSYVNIWLLLQYICLLTFIDLLHNNRAILQQVTVWYNIRKSTRASFCTNLTAIEYNSKTITDKRNSVENNPFKERTMHQTCQNKMSNIKCVHFSNIWNSESGLHFHKKRDHFLYWLMNILRMSICPKKSNKIG